MVVLDILEENMMILRVGLMIEMHLKYLKTSRHTAIIKLEGVSNE